MADAYDDTAVAVSNAMIALHKEQFGRGPRKARTHFAGPDAMITVLEDALLPAEKALVAMGEVLRVQETRMFLQDATRERFIKVIETIVPRKIRSFQSASDGRTGVVTEIAIFEPLESVNDRTAEAVQGTGA